MGKCMTQFNAGIDDAGAVHDQNGVGGVLSGEASLQRVRGYEDSHRLAYIVAGAGTQSVGAPGFTGSTRSKS